MLIQKGTDLTQKEVITLKEVGFSFDRSHVRSLLVPNYLVQAVCMCLL
jgi:hypothetical protein